MRFNTHLGLIGKHAILSASKYHWVNYDEDRFDRFVRMSNAAALGTRLHDLASKLIELGVKLPEEQKTLNMFVNDAIDLRMTTEQPLFYSEYAFGTADAISFRSNYLRVHDYKSGVRAVNITQLEVYAALFCLEYRVKPKDIVIELRIYQNDDIISGHPEIERIENLMSLIVERDKRIREIEEEQ